MQQIILWTKPIYWHLIFKNFKYILFKPTIRHEYFIFPGVFLFFNTKFHTSISIYSFSSYNLYKLYLQYMTITWVTFLNVKVKFRHKISWIKSYYWKLNYLIVDTNRSHYLIYLLQDIYTKRRKKYFTYNTLILKSANYLELQLIANLIVKSFPWDKYTSRGFRLSRQKLYRRPGKVSQYSMLKTKIF